MLFPEYVLWFAHPVLVIESTYLSAQEILDFPFVMEMIFTEQHLCLQILETGTFLIISLRSSVNLPHL